MKTSYKKDFFNYVLFNYEFDDRVAVWILNFIKSHPEISKNITFNNTYIDRKLRIAESRTGRPTLVFEKGSTLTTDGETIFHELNLNQELQLYIEFSFLDDDIRYDQAKKLEYEEDRINLSDHIHQLEEAIDDALKAYDEPLFMELTDTLHKLKQGES